jgi:three-Cys-motif partner protein
MTPRPDQEWIYRQLDQIYKYADPLAEQDSKTDDWQPWKALKLVTLAHSVYVYTQILGNDRWEDFYYVDALAGSGIQQRDDGTNFVGSSLLAPIVAENPFSHLYFIEEDTDKAEALSQRLQYASENIDSFAADPSDYTVINRDVNSPHAMSSIPDEISNQRERGLKGAHALAFVDNQRAEVNWETIAAFGDANRGGMWSDFLVNYQPVGIDREEGDYSFENLDGFFGPAEYRGLSDDEQFENYRENFTNIEPPRSIQRHAKVRGSASFRYYYNMLFATQETGSGSPYIEFMEGAKEKIENLSGDDIDNVIEILKGNQAPLDLFSEHNDDQDSDPTTESGFGFFQDS